MTSLEPIRSTHRRLGRALAGAALLLALTGCTDTAPSPTTPTASPRSSPVRTPTPTISATAVLDPLIRSEGRITATGAVGATRIAIAPDDDGFRVSLTGYRPASSASGRLILTTIATGSACASALRVDAGSLGSASDQSFVRPYPWDNTYEDLSMLTHAVLLPQGMTWSAACTAGRATTIALQWDVPEALAQLSVADRGARYGAHGDVVTRAGAPLRYEVAKGDLLNDVATRFGLTPDELLWLTPSRARGQDGLVYTGEQLNLDPSSRGLST